MTGESPVDSFIDRAQPFARPIVTHLRALVHATVPGAAEAIKWGMPFFTVQGKNLCGIGAFKTHCSFVIEDAGARGGEGMGHFGKIRSLADLPDDAVLADLLLARAQRIAAGVRLPSAPRADKPEIALPDDFAAALSPAARVFLDGLTAAQRRDYLDWITSAKRAETRAKRIAEAAGWLDQGKKRNWKYEDC